MARRFALLAWFAIVVVAISPAEPVLAASTVCTPFETNSGACTVSGGIADGAAVLTGSAGSPGSGNGGGAASSTPPPCVIVNGQCKGLASGPARGVATEPVTLTDIAAFRPSPGRDSMEPNGWMVVGLDTNFYSTVGVQVQDGTLLGQPASVRFTPVRWHWTYGDGAAASRGTPGRTWAAQAAPEFGATPTSHIYRSSGTYYIDLSIDFAAEYRFAATDWVPIHGLINLPANRLVATAGGAKTVLVERECTVNPAGPGC